MSFEGNYHAALKRIVALEQERDDYILKQKVWEEASRELPKLSNDLFLEAIRKSYLGSEFDSDPRIAAAWWGWRAARGELESQAGGEGDVQKT